EGFSDLPLLITADPTIDSTYRAVDSIFGNVTIANNLDITFKAGRVITLGAGFHATSGSHFLAQIEGCPAAPTQRTFAEWQLEQTLLSTPNIHIFPNPMRTSTTIQYEVTQPAEVWVEVYDLTGRLVERPVAGELQSVGIHQVEWVVSGSLGSGVYLVRVLTGREMFFKKIVVE
ncbi:MAG: T9SS type A sorting domain-containing protein, partial [Bacteroidota bacterium]